MGLCCLTVFRFLNPLYQLDCVCRVEAEEDNQDFRLFDSAINPFESLVFFLYPQAIGQISCNVIFQFVIGKRIPWDDSDTTDWGIFCNHIQRHTIGLSALSAWRLPDGRQSGSGKGRSHPTNEVWRIHQRHFTMFLSRIITSRYIAVKWLRRVYWLTSHEHRRFSRLAPTILLLRIDDSFRKHRWLFFKSPWMLGEVNQLHFQKESFPAFTGFFFSSSTESADSLTEVTLHQQTPPTRPSCFCWQNVHIEHTEPW